MPYIEPADRLKLGRDIDNIVNSILLCSKSCVSIGDTSDAVVGNLNYVLTRIAVLVTKELAFNHYNKTSKLSYALLNKIWGVLNGVSTEFYRKVVVPYEDYKKRENGDVYNELLMLID